MVCKEKHADIRLRSDLSQKKTKHRGTNFAYTHITKPKIITYPLPFLHVAGSQMEWPSTGKLIYKCRFSGTLSLKNKSILLKFYTFNRSQHQTNYVS